MFGSMIKLSFAVLRFGDDWSVVRPASRVGPFPTSAEAEHVACDLARQAHGMGYEAEVLIPLGAGELRRLHVARTVH